MTIKRINKWNINIYKKTNRNGKRLEIGEINKSLEFFKIMVQLCWREDPRARPAPFSILEMFPKS